MVCSTCGSPDVFLDAEDEPYPIWDVNSQSWTQNGTDDMQGCCNVCEGCVELIEKPI
jgi:hypothetical protein